MNKNRHDNNRKICRNCNMMGHISSQCNKPYISYGVILVNIKGNIKINNDLFDTKKHIIVNDDQCNQNSKYNFFSQNVEFLLVKRRNTFEYAEFIMGRYNPNKLDKIIFLLSFMTQKELSDIIHLPFEKLWSDFWSNDETKMNSMYFIESRNKFNRLINNEENKLVELVKKTEPKWTNEEWGFPKGKRKISETDYQCALREFYEETGIDPSLIKILTNVEPIKEEFTGTDGCKYTHIYFTGICNDNIISIVDSSNKLQISEIGDIGFYKLYDAISKIRPYQNARLNILMKIYSFIIKYIDVDEQL